MSSPETDPIKAESSHSKYQTKGLAIEDVAYLFDKDQVAVPTEVREEKREESEACAAWIEFFIRCVDCVNCLLFLP